jgi:hypothetical protein
LGSDARGRGGVDRWMGRWVCAPAPKQAIRARGVDVAPRRGGTRSREAVRGHAVAVTHGWTAADGGNSKRPVDRGEEPARDGG